MIFVITPAAGLTRSLLKSVGQLYIGKLKIKNINRNSVILLKTRACALPVEQLHEHRLD